MKEDLLDKICEKMIDYNSGDAKRIQHFLKVHDFARIIGLKEGLDDKTLLVLEIAAYVHDIGIRLSEEKYGSCAGTYQELCGPAEAEALLNDLGVNEEVISRVSFLVGHHHTYTDIDGIDYQILVEADFLVNFYEDAMSIKQILSVKENIFRTHTGKVLLDKIFCIKKL